ncbi:MAG TPA: NADH-quinone oxidoreductase subunit L [Solirubrobacterales bacterium]|nr:NADH-quinone oxidoreductase subunit L [Solirubrobacterales bacterium]
MDATTYGWLILAFPLAGSMVIALGWRALPGRAAGWIGTGAIGLAFLCAIGALVQILDHPVEDRQLTNSLYDYASAGGLDIQMNVLVDPLSVFMCLVVTGVSTLIHLYSISYMTSDDGFRRFFSYLNFFVFSMLLLLLAGNLILLIVGWAFVGFASYALISFWFRRGTATGAGMKAFVINVVGDVGLVIAALFIFRELGTFDLLQIFERAPEEFTTNEGVAVAIGCLLLVGAAAKSAQVPLHTWLPDAMEGPTPVSALIHAATMVTAGVYLIGRFHPVFEIALTAADIAAFIGLATLLIAATIALVVTDLKRIIAYSTMSQIGYMVMGVGIGAYSAAFFHLMTHAFFKALLFMAAGSIIGAMANRQNIDLMGGFRRAMPFTVATLLIGCLALAAFPGTSGFFSKDEILAFAEHRGGFYWVFAIGGYIGALLTAFYAFRIGFRVAYGDPVPEAREVEAGHISHAEPENPATGEREDTDIGFPGPEHHIAEREWPMKIAMSVLAFGALFAGLVQVPGVDAVIEHFLEGSFEDSTLYNDLPSNAAEWRGLGVGSIISLLGIGFAAVLYLQRPGTTKRLAERFAGIHKFLENKWYFDEAIDFLIVRPALGFGRWANSVFERYVVNGLVVGTVGAAKGANAAVRVAQSGYLRGYALLLVLGFCGLALYFLIAGS